MNSIESCLSETYSDMLKIWSAERFNEKLTEKLLTVDESFKITFDKYNFKNHKGDIFEHEIDGIHFIPWLHKYILNVFKNSVNVNDQLDLKVKVLYKRDDGIELGYIQYLTIGKSITSSDYDYLDYGLDEYENEDFQPLVIIDFDSLIENNLLVQYDDNTKTYELSCYRNKHHPNEISYHYWNEK